MLAWMMLLPVWYRPRLALAMNIFRSLLDAISVQVAAWAKDINVSGVMLDFEPETSNATWVRAYAAYVKALSDAMHRVGLLCEMCISDWGILDGHTIDEGYGIYAAAGVDRMMSMAGTYYGTNVSKNEANVRASA